MAASFFHSNQELIYLATACRTAARLEREHATAQESLTVKGHHEAAAREYERMAQLFEDARKLAER